MRVWHSDTIVSTIVPQFQRDQRENQTGPNTYSGTRWRSISMDKTRYTTVAMMDYGFVQVLLATGRDVNRKNREQTMTL